MKKLDLGQIITILANVGVIAGIVFLGIELQQNNELLRSQARYGLHLARSGEVDDLWRNPDMLELFQKAGNGSLTDVENGRLQNFSISRWIRWEWYYEQYRDGLIEQSNLPTVGWQRNMSTSWAIDRWDQNAELFSPDFVQFMEENVINR